MKHASPQHASHSRRAPGWLLFGLLQLVLLTSFATAAVIRDWQWQANTLLPQIRLQPRMITPRYDRPEVVSDEQLKAVLLKLRPKLAGREPKINHVDHALRFWGVEATFSESEYLSGAQMRGLLTDHRVFAEVWGETARPLLISTPRGIQVRTREGNATASHTDHTLAGLGEVGTPADFPIRTISGDATLAELVHASLATFSLNQGEYEWSTLIQALYLVKLDGWRTTEGQRVDFDLLSERLMREAPKQGVCFGNHRLYTLAALLQIDESEPLLSRNMRQRTISHLQTTTAALVRNQHAYGYWDGNWATKAASSGEDLSELGNRILATGHALEWWAIAPPEVQPPRETLIRAGQWLTRTIESLDHATVEQSYTYLTHAGRALALWRNTTPAQILIPHGTLQENSVPAAAETLKK